MTSLKLLLRDSFPERSDLSGLPDISIQSIESDSRAVQKGALFVAVKGAVADGRQFIEDALNRGAAAVVGEGPRPESCAVPFIEVQDTRQAAARLATSFYDHPTKRLSMVGITGTNGKTTSAYLLEHFLNSAHKKTGVLGTVSHRYPGKETLASETTPGPLKLQAILKEMADANCEWAVMEVSSHALDQRRTEGIRFKAALFTNLTQDHLDYHHTLEAYFEAKAKLFLSLEPSQTAVLNADDAWNQKLRNRLSCRVLTYSVNGPSDFKAESIRFENSQVHFNVRFQNQIIPVSTSLLGSHNIYNILGATAVFHALGFNLGLIPDYLQSFIGVPGRLERVDAGQNFHVFIDFAHTPDGLENVLKSLQAYKKNRLITLFGCGGDRDRGKRPKMAEIAARLSDQVIVTSDNPRSEDPKAIAQEICAGFTQDFKNFSVILDRKKGIRQALMDARENDIVILAGKGHERNQVIGAQSFPFSDREEAIKVLNGH